MAVRNGSNVIEAETDDADLTIGSIADGRHRIDEDWYYVGSTDNYSRRIEGEPSAGGRINHIVLWNCGSDAMVRDATHQAHLSLIGCELGNHPASAGEVRVIYGAGAEPALATITIGTASVVFDPRTIADVILWNTGARADRPRPLFTWDTSARSGAGAFVFAGYTG